MKKTLTASAAAFSLLLAACGPGDTEDAQPTTTVEAIADVETTDQATTSVATAPQAGAPQTSEPSAGAAPQAGATLRSSVLGKTLDANNELSSARFEGTINFVGAAGSELPGDVSLKFAGAYDLANDASEMSMDFGGIIEAAAASESGGDDIGLFADFFKEPLQVITVGEKSWIKWGLLAIFTGADDKWLEGEDGSAGDLASGFGVGGASGSPTDILETLADANADVEEIGTEELRGVQTTHYRALIDAEALAESMSAREREEFESDLGASPISEFPMEFWLDDQGLLHRYRMDLSDPALLSESDGELESAEIIFDMWDHGADLDIQPPPADQIVSEDELGFDLSDFAS